MRINLSDDAKYIIEKLNKSGYECYAVGGCIRDLIMGKKPADNDFTTDATPEQIEECFNDCCIFRNGKKFGTITVLINDYKYEITTYRTESDYNDNRHPSDVIFVKNLTEDLKRRDFTINALAYSHTAGLVDLFDSVSDIKAGLIRCVGDPDKRFNEDALRILRALRFASKLGFEIETDTSASIFKNRELLNNIAVERISKEFVDILLGDHVKYVLDEYRDVFAVFIPEIVPMFGFEQRSLHHCYDLWNHTLETIVNSPEEELIRVSLFFHDLGKVDTRTFDGVHHHFKGHPAVSAEYAHTILKRLRFSNEFIHETVLLIKYHDVRFKGNRKSIKKALGVLGPELMKKLFCVQKADLMAQSDYLRDEKELALKNSIDVFNEIIRNNECFDKKQLEINGRDLIDIGIKEGSDIGYVLDLCVENVIEGNIRNNREELLLFAEDIKNGLTNR